MAPLAVGRRRGGGQGAMKTNGLGGGRRSTMVALEVMAPPYLGMALPSVEATKVEAGGPP